MNLRITGGRIIDPGRYEGPGDILVVDGKIAAVHRGESGAASIEASSRPYRMIDAFGKIVAAAFSRRRKTLRNALQGYFRSADFERIGVDARLRAQDLRVEDFVRLANAAG